MPNYYEILQIRPDAPAPEIEAACEAQYNRWRRLVTHHDPETADKATRALRILEQIRATLTDPAKRAAYDATLDLSDTMSGLADPQAQPARPVAPPLPPRPPVAPQIEPPVAPAARLDAWLCPKCHSASPVDTRYCRHCGEEIGRPCPKCAKLIEKAIRFCPECGVEVEAYIAEKQREAEEFARRQQEEARRQAEERARQEARARERRRRRNRVIGYGVGLLVIVVLAWVVISSAIQFAEEQKYHAQATATMAAQYANATAMAVLQDANATTMVEALRASDNWIDKNGSVMLYVPAGEFPYHNITWNAFWIQRTEVTNAQYQKCVMEGVCTPSVYADDSNFNGDDRPVVGVSLHAALVYCQWMGMTLPSPEQWRVAACGMEIETSPRYPWGTVFQPGLLNCPEEECQDGYMYSAPVGSFPKDVSWVGALDMTGNVSEIVLKKRSDNSWTVKGGDWRYGPYKICERDFYSWTSGGATSEPNNHLGFRCVAIHPQEQ